MILDTGLLLPVGCCCYCWNGQQSVNQWPTRWSKYRSYHLSVHMLWRSRIRWEMTHLSASLVDRAPIRTVQDNLAMRPVKRVNSQLGLRQTLQRFASPVPHWDSRANQIVVRGVCDSGDYSNKHLAQSFWICFFQIIFSVSLLDFVVTDPTFTGGFSCTVELSRSGTNYNLDLSDCCEDETVSVHVPKGSAISAAQVLVFDTIRPSVTLARTSVSPTNTGMVTLMSLSVSQS